MDLPLFIPCGIISVHASIGESQVFDQMDFTSLKEILSAAKDLLLIAVAVVTSIISIKSYKNARLALAQPLKLLRKMTNL
mgnify:CR=1